MCVFSNVLKFGRSLVWRWITQHPLQWVSTVLRARCQPKFTAPRVLWRSALSPSWTKVCVGMWHWSLASSLQHEQSRNFDSILLLVLQINTPSGSSPERTVSTPLMSNSMALTFQEVLSKFGSGNQDRLETLVWSRCTELDWREAQLVGYLSEGLQFTSPYRYQKKTFLLKCGRYSVRVHYQQHQGGSWSLDCKHWGSIQSENGMPRGPRWLQGAVHSHGSWALPDQR